MTDMTSQPRMRGLSRRALLSRTAGSVASLAIGANFICATDAACHIRIDGDAGDQTAAKAVLGRDCIVVNFVLAIDGLIVSA
jgi:hypothetical protein